MYQACSFLKPQKPLINIFSILFDVLKTVLMMQDRSQKYKVWACVFNRSTQTVLNIFKFKLSL